MLRRCLNRAGNATVSSTQSRTCADKVRLGDVCEIAAGQGAPQGDSKYSAVGTPFIKAGDLSRLLAGCPECEIQKVTEATVREYKLKLQPSGSLLFAKSGMSCMKGYVYRLHSDCYVVSHLAIVKPSEKVCSRYLEHCFRFVKPNRLVKDPAYPSISLADISDLVIPLPPLATQRCIADELDKECALKKNAENRLAILDQIVRSKFVEVFGDPVLNDKGWPTSGLLEIGECKNGMNFSPKDSGYSLRCVGVGDFKDKVTLDDLERIATINVNARPKDDLILKDGDILFVRSNGNKALVGRSLLVRPGLNEVTFSGFCIRYRISSKAFLPEFAIHFLKHDAVRKALRGRGANIQNLSQKTIQTIQAILPPLPLQRKFAKFVAEVEKLKANLRETAATLDQIYRAKQQEYFG